MKASRPQQLHIVFADSPEGAVRAEEADVSAAEASMAHPAACSQRAESTSRGAADTSRLLELVASEENLVLALENVASNDGAPGVDGVSVKEVVAHAARLRPLLRRALLSESFVPGDIRRVWIDKSGGGQRGLGIPNVIDRWVQRAVLQILEPLYEPTFHPSSHGFRPKRGAHTAIAEAAVYVTRGRPVTVDIDLSKFFDRVNHQRLLDRMAQRIADRRILRFVRLMLTASVVMPDGVRVATEEGTPQGGPLSPLLSNIVLDELDQELARRRLRFVRYADDCNIYVRSERAGRRVMASIRRFIEGRLRLKVNEEKSAVDLARHRHFLGFRVGATRKQRPVVQLSQRSFERLDAKLRALTPRTWGRSLEACFAGLASYMQGWMGYFRLCTREVHDTLEYFDCHVRRRLRAIIVRQKKRPRHLYRHLRRHGSSSPSAHKAAYSSRGAWWQSQSGALEYVHDNDWFAARMPSLLALWKAQHHDWRSLGLRPEEPDVRSTCPVP